MEVCLGGNASWFCFADAGVYTAQLFGLHCLTAGPVKRVQLTQFGLPTALECQILRRSDISVRDIDMTDLAK